MKKNTQNKAFTLIELLVVISIISLLASILLPKLQQARAKADDVRRKAVLKNIQSQIIGDKADATTNFSDIFSSGSKAKDMLDTLISQTGVSSTDYDAKVSSDGTSYAVVFPLKADPTKYWCVDSTGVSKEVGGRLMSSSASCAKTKIGSNPDLELSLQFQSPSPVACGAVLSPSPVVFLKEINGNPLSANFIISIADTLYYDESITNYDISKWSVSKWGGMYRITPNNGFLPFANGGEEYSFTINMTKGTSYYCNYSGFSGWNGIMQYYWSSGDTNTSNDSFQINNLPL